MSHFKDMDDLLIWLFFSPSNYADKNHNMHFDSVIFLKKKKTESSREDDEIQM